MTARRRDPLKEALARTVLSTVQDTGALKGWLATLGELGAPPRPGQRAEVPASTRVQAARAGLDFVSKFIGDAADTEAGRDLLDALGKLEETAEKLDGEQASAPADGEAE